MSETAMDNLLMCLWLFTAVVFVQTEAACAPNGDPCKFHEDCCRGYCSYDICGVCRWWGKCDVPEQCCSKYCVGGRCSLFPPAPTTTVKPCAEVGGFCRFNRDCCDGNLCSFRQCKAPRPTQAPSWCLEDGSLCFDNYICCSKSCDGFFCSPACKRINNECERKSDCCSNFCSPVQRRNKVLYICTTSCIKKNKYCEDDDQCCPGLKCQDNTCITGDCLDEEESCTMDSECCSGPCQEGTCVLCANSGDYCRKTDECCKGMTCTYQRCREGVPLDPDM